MLKVKLNLSKVVAIAACFAVATMFSGCGEDEKQPDIKVENEATLIQTVYADQTSGVTTTIVTSGAWSSTITEGSAKSTKSSTVSWLNIAPSSGTAAGTYPIVTSLEPNLSGAERSATITIKCGDMEINIVVTQKTTKENGDPYVELPALTTATATNITATSATTGGSIANVGMPVYTERGVCYGTIANPTVGGNSTKLAVEGSGTGSFMADLTGLTSKTTYYVRAYATNSNGTVYGNQVEFTTEAAAKEQIIKMTTEKEGEVELIIGGTGEMIIDWGDGTPEEAYIASGSSIFSPKYTHSYSNANSRTITIYGENIIYLGCLNNQLESLNVSNNPTLISLDCSRNQLKSLDMSNNTAITHLTCSFNQLESLDMSNNTALMVLYCSYNQLKNLNVSNNPALTYLGCNNNQLESLDVSKSTALYGLRCNDNQLSGPALNALFETLHSNSISGALGTKYIYLGGNAPQNTFDVTIAGKKGWAINW